MNYYTRLLCYDDPSRKTSTQIHPDIVGKELPQFGYATILRVGSDDDDPDSWPPYVVGNVVHMQQIPDPADENKNALLAEVYLVRYEEWDQFDIPPIIQEIMDEEENLSAENN